MIPREILKKHPADRDPHESHRDWIGERTRLGCSPTRLAPDIRRETWLQPNVTRPCPTPPTSGTLFDELPVP
jgi:hypothetical protein